jgi:oxygen-independent coproporphyrinogen-3 oxidase
MNGAGIGLYVHLPWCVRKCPYCDFNSHPLGKALPEADYLAALLADLDLEAPTLAGRRIESIFFGGGTPSLFSAASLGRVIEAADRAIGLAPDAEITLEANPGTIEHDTFESYAGTGINRISLGVQSFDAKQLKILGRIHGPDEARQAVAQLHRAGIENFNLDLMYALPGQDVAGVIADITAALELEPAHISHYQLTLEPGTLFHAYPPQLPDDDQAWDMQLAAQAALADAGFEQYEVSAYAHPGRQSRHNLNYWRFGEYLGIGAGAHSLLRAGNDFQRKARIKHPGRYMARAGSAEALAEMRKVEATERVFEFMLNALRLRAGFSPAQFEMATGLDFEPTLGQLERARTLGLMECVRGYWRPSERGRALLNDLQAFFLPADNEPLEPTDNPKTST